MNFIELDDTEDDIMIINDKSTGKEYYRQNDNIIINSVNILIPYEIELIMRQLNHNYPKYEYSILGNSKYDKKNKTYVMDNTYVIPKQEVTGTHIDYLEDYPNLNTVIHKHPDGCMNFSGTDEMYINSNFEISLLWVNNALHKGQCKLKTNIGYIKLPLKIYVKYPSIKVVGMENIMVKKFKESDIVLQNFLDQPF